MLAMVTNIFRNEIFVEVVVEVYKRKVVVMSMQLEEQDNTVLKLFTSIQISWLLWLMLELLSKIKVGLVFFAK